MNTILWPVFLLLNVTASLVTAGDELIPARDPSAIQFSGLEEFDQASIRRSLLRLRDFRKAQTGELDDTQFLSLLQSLVESGVRSNGFPEATVSVTQGDDSVIHVNVQPGAPWKWAPVRVITSDENADVSALRQFFENWQHADFRVASGLKGWNPTDSVNTSSGTANDIKELAEEAAKQDLREGMQCTVEFEFQTATREIVPVVHVSEAGFHTLISDIVFEGNTINSDQVLLDFLQIPSGCRLTGELSSKIRNKLLDNGRILHVRVACDAPFGADHAVPLRISLHERAGSVPLNEPLPEYEQALCRLAAWISNSKDAGIDVQIRSASSVPAEELRNAATATIAKHSPVDLGQFDVLKAFGITDARNGSLTCTTGKSGCMLRFQSGDSAGNEQCDFAIGMGPGLIGLYDMTGHRKWTHTGELPSITNPIHLCGTTNPEYPRSLKFGPGWSSWGEPGFHTSLKIEPAALISSLVTDSEGVQAAVVDGICTITSPTLTVRFEADSGRLLCMKSTDEVSQIELICAPGLLKQELDGVSSQLLEEQNIAGRDCSTLVRFFLPYIRRGYGENAEAKLLTILDRALSQDSSLDRLFNRQFVELQGRVFSIPSTERRSETAKSTPWFLQCIESSAALGSRVERLTALLDDDMSDPEIRRAFLHEFRQHDKIGPVGCLYLSWCCRGIQSQIAAEGLRRLNYANFRRDADLFLAEATGIRDMVDEFIQVVREMTADEVEVVAVAIDRLAGNTESMEQAASITRIRSAVDYVRTPGVTADQAIDSLTRVVWESFLQQMLKEQLSMQLETNPKRNPFVKASSGTSTDHSSPKRSEALRKNASASDPTTLLNDIKPFEPPVSPNPFEDRVIER